MKRSTIPACFDLLRQRHEEEVERYRALLSVRFQKRAEWLVKQIQRELPQVGGLVTCNGDSWFVPVGYPQERKATVTWKRADSNHPFGPTYEDDLRNLLRDIDSEDVPDVSRRCLSWLRELDELTVYCADARFHTLAIPSTV